MIVAETTIGMTSGLLAPVRRCNECSLGGVREIERRRTSSKMFMTVLSRE